MRVLVLTMFTLSILASAQQDPLAWSPLQVGTRWSYQHEWKSGDRTHPRVNRWTTVETITTRLTIPEGLVVLRQVKQQSGTPNSAYLVSRDHQPYLIHANCLYVIDNGWDSQARQLRPSYREYLAKGARAPDFCFPLQPGRAWGNNDLPWQVRPAREDLRSFLPAQYAAAIHIFSSHFGSGGWDDVWFKKASEWWPNITSTTALMTNTARN